MAGKGEAGKLWIFLGLQASEFQKGLKQVANDINKAKKQWKSLDTIGKSMDDLGKKMTMSLTLPLAGLAAGAVAAANTIDDGMDAIRSGTGATGGALDSLGRSFREVLGSVPAQTEDAAAAIADLNTRLNITGPALEATATQMLNLARVTKAQVGPLIGEMTRVFGDWSIGTARQSYALDYLYKVTQQTGIGIDALGQSIVQYGAPLRQMGFSFEQAAAMVGKFEAEGVNTELVMGSLRIALGKMAKEGISSPVQALSILTQRIKEAGSTGQANALAIETFGSRAGPDMAAAIREGRFELDGLVKKLQGSDETINKAAKDTMSLGEVMTLLKNKVTLASEPVGKSLTEAFLRLEPTIERMVQSVANLANWFANLSPGTQSALITAVAIVAAVGPLLAILGNLVLVIQAVAAAFTFFAVSETIALGPILLIVGAIIAVIAIVAVLHKAWTNDWGGIQEKTASAISWIKNAFSAVVKFIKDWWPLILAPLTGGFSLIAFFFTDKGKELLGKAAEWGKNIIAGLWNGISSLAAWIKEKVTGFVAGIGQTIKDFFGIHSPSTVMDHEVGQQLVNGIIVGMERRAPAVKASAKNVAEAIQGVFDYMMKHLDNNWQLFTLTTAAAENSTEYLQTKLANLQQQLGLVGTELGKAQSAYDASVSASGLYSEATMKLGEALDELKIKQADLGKQVAETTKAMSDQTLTIKDGMAYVNQGSFSVGVPTGLARAWDEGRNAADVIAIANRQRVDMSTAASMYDANQAAIANGQLPKYHSGGIYRAPNGRQEGLAVLRDGETVLPAGAKAGVTIQKIEIIINEATDAQKVARIAQAAITRGVRDAVLQGA